MSLLKKTQLKRKRIRTAAEECFLEQGLMNTSMRDISEKAQVSLGSLYQYFPDKDALLKEVIVDNYLEVKQALNLVRESKNIVKTLKELVKGFVLELADKNEAALLLEIYAAAVRDDKLLGYLQEYDDEAIMLGDILQQAAQQGQLQLALPPRVAAESILSILESLAMKTLFEPDYQVAQAMEDSWLVIQQLLHIEENWAG